VIPILRARSKTAGMLLRGMLLVVSIPILCAFEGAPGEGSFDAPLPRTPLAPPLVITGGFGEFRIGHFHAGLDLGTGQRVGRVVLAPARGWIERVRASGVGYGRSLYLRTDDGRLLQFGHLDAFVEPVASYVGAIQDSSGQYEQDLWPERGRFRFKAGDRIAWTGESGAGGPHLHFEVRRGDMAYHPLRAGLVTPDSMPPTLVSLTLEPLDDTSTVERSAAPITISLGAEPETVAVRGRLRAYVGARDGAWRGVDRMVPWSVSMTWEERMVECRFDSVSWATDMAEGDYVYDAGRATGSREILLWAPAGFRARVIHADSPPTEEAGTITVRPHDPPRILTLMARDLGGGLAERRVVLRPENRTTAERKTPMPSGPFLAFASLPGGYLRVAGRLMGEPPRVGLTRSGRVYTARRAREGWAVVLPAVVRKSAPAWADTVRVDGNRYPVWVASITPRDSIVLVPSPEWKIEVPAGAVFEKGVLVAVPGDRPERAGELEPVTRSVRFEPERFPLRRPARLTATLGPAGPHEHVGLFREGDDGWDFVSSSLDSTGGYRFTGDARRLGRFALFRDNAPPRVTRRAPPRRATSGRYSRWAVEAGVEEEGSGLDGRASYFVVDGKRVPTEWDSEEKTLRWRPAKRPKSGRHRVEIVAADRMGNTSRTAGIFVLD